MGTYAEMAVLTAITQATVSGYTDTMQSYGYDLFHRTWMLARFVKHGRALWFPFLERIIVIRAWMTLTPQECSIRSVCIIFPFITRASRMEHCAVDRRLYSSRPKGIQPAAANGTVNGRFGGINGGRQQRQRRRKNGKRSTWCASGSGLHASTFRTRRRRFFGIMTARAAG